jgi:hypothetical protein
MIRLFSVLIFFAFVNNQSYAQSHTHDTSIRKTNWIEYFKHSPDFVVESTNDTMAFGRYLGRYYVWSSDTTKDEGDRRDGYPAIDHILYGDLDGDGRDEAIIFFDVGGSALNESYALFRTNGNAPSLVQWGSGYRFWGRIRNDTLLIFNPMYIGSEPNCCPSGERTDFYRLKNNKLILLDSLFEANPGTAGRQVEAFYQLLSAKDFSYAYEMLGKHFCRKHPYDKWVAGYKNSMSIEVQSINSEKNDSIVQVSITSTDRTLKGLEVSHYKGTWKLSWNRFNGWMLEEPKIRKVKK